MSSEKKRGELGRVLVIGGNGFLGHHIVNQALESWSCTHVSSVDLRCERNRNAAAVYRECDITDTAKLTSIFEELKPDVVIHTASPVAVDNQKARELFKKVNVGGTQSVVDACQNAGVNVLVYTSSASVVSDGSTNLYNADERWPVIRGDQQKEYYSETKAHAEDIVLKSNRLEPYPNLLTTSIRPAGIFGEGDVQTLAGFYNAYKSGNSRVQIGDNTNLFDFTYVGNVAHGHLLAAQRLLATAKASTKPLDHERVDGEVFFITNDSPVYFWDFARSIFRAAGDDNGLKGVWTMSPGLGNTLGFFSEVFASIVRKQATFTTQKVTMTTMTRYYNITKAKRVLGYMPLWTLQEGVDRGVAWFLEQEGKQKTN